VSALGWLAVAVGYLGVLLLMLCMARIAKQADRRTEALLRRARRDVLTDDEVGRASEILAAERRRRIADARRARHPDGDWQWPS
jgi:hypothetical protein